MVSAKIEAQKQWTKNPCGAVGEQKHSPNTAEYFDEIKDKRYNVYDTWMKRTIDFGMARDKKILEVGFGLGTDLLEFCNNNAKVYGIDITKKHYDLASKNFLLHNKHAELKLCDCENIDYPSNYFDYVYSNGVLHHTENTEKCLSEIYRVLKPGGRLVFSVYYKYSAFHVFTKLLYQGILCGKLKKLGYRGLMATTEYGADGINIKPLVKTYSKRKLKNMMSDFKEVNFKVAHFQLDHMAIFKRFVPKKFESKLEKYLGWYVVTYATK